MKKSLFLLLISFFIINFENVNASQAINENGWSFALNAGVSPAVFTRKGSIETNVVLQNSPRTYTNSVGFHRSKLFHFPWGFGADVAFGVHPDIELFGSIQYTRANNKTITLISYPHIKGELDNFGHLGFYAGGRYFYDIRPDISIFGGLKMGLAYIESVHIRGLGLGLGLGTEDSGKSRIFKGSTEFSGGIQLGAEHLINENFSARLMFEIIGTTRFSHKRRFGVLSSNPNDVRVKVGRSPGGMFFFPIMAAIRYRV